MLFHLFRALVDLLDALIYHLKTRDHQLALMWGSSSTREQCAHEYLEQLVVTQGQAYC